MKTRLEDTELQIPVTGRTVVTDTHKVWEWGNRNWNEFHFCHIVFKKAGYSRSDQEVTGIISAQQPSERWSLKIRSRTFLIQEHRIHFQCEDHNYK